MIISNELAAMLETFYESLVVVGVLILFHRAWRAECDVMYNQGRLDALRMRAAGLKDSDIRSCLRVCSAISARQGPYEKGMLSVLETK